MTRDDIIRMMRSVCDTDKVDAWHNEFWTVTQDELERFAAIVAAAEREKFIDYPKGEVCGPCVCGSWPGGDCLRCPPTEEYLAAIRARGKV
jgi:hypothetical protein